MADEKLNIIGQVPITDLPTVYKLTGTIDYLYPYDDPRPLEVNSKVNYLCVAKRIYDLQGVYDVWAIDESSNGVNNGWMQAYFGGYSHQFLFREIIQNSSILADYALDESGEFLEVFYYEGLPLPADDKISRKSKKRGNLDVR